MRQIMADVVSEASMLVTSPLGEQRTLKIAEPGAANDGPTGFAGVGRYIYSEQELQVKIEKSGAYGAYVRWRDSRFVWKMDHCKNAAGTEKADAHEYMGAEPEYMPCYSQLITAGGIPGTSQISSPAILSLKRHGGNEVNAGRIGLLACVYHLTGVASVVRPYFWKLTAGQEEYKWELMNPGGIRNQTGLTVEPCLDMVELDDGTIIISLVYENVIEYWKSFDAGDNWVLVADETAVGGIQSYRCTIERIGNRIVHLYGFDDAGTIKIYAMVSIDNGATWIDEGIVLSHAATVTVFDMDLRRGKDGWLYLVYLDHNDIVLINKTRDGVNWTASVGAQVGDGVNFATYYVSLSLYQTKAGSWRMYGTRDNIPGANAVLRPVMISNGIFYPQLADDPYDSSQLWSVMDNQKADANLVLPNTVDSDGMNALDVSIDGFENETFLDMVTLYKDTHSGDKYALVVTRFGMWSGIQPSMYSGVGGISTSEQFDTVWLPHAYPSTADAHPNLNHWSRQITGGGTSTLQTTQLGHIQLTTVALNENANYYKLLQPDSYDSGVVCRFEAKVVAGIAKIRVILCSDGGASNVDVDFQIELTTTAVNIYDFNAAHEIATETPTNWDPTEWNSYILVAKGQAVYLYRAPSDVYREIAPYELVLSATNLTTAVYSGDNDEVRWGAISVPANNPVSDTLWRCFMIADETAWALAWNFNTDPVGKRGLYDPVGLLQGISCKFGGEYAIENDTWDLDVGAVYAADNIFTSSPSVQWKEPAQVAGANSPARIIEWRMPQDDDSEDMNFVFDGFALFGRNFFGFKIEGMDYNEANKVTLYDSVAGVGINDHIAYWGVQKIGVTSYIWENVVRVGPPPVPGAYPNFAPMVPDMFKSDGLRNWYIRVTAGSAAGNTYRVVGNTEQDLILESNAEGDGLTGEIPFYLFGSSYFYRFSEQKRHQRIKLTIASQSRTTSELSIQLGTFVLGRAYDMDDDAWGASYRTIPNNVIIKGASGRKVASERGKVRRAVDVRYTGQQGKGMGVTWPSALYRAMVGGKHPLVWLDDDSSFINNANKGYHDPLLVRYVGPMSQRHVAYHYYDDTATVGLGRGLIVSNILDVNSITLEEEL